MLGKTLVKREIGAPGSTLGNLGTMPSFYFELRNGTTAIEPTNYLVERSA